MAKSITVKRKKVGRPATGTEPLYGVRISDELMGQIQKWGRENSATRSEAIRRLADLGLKGKKRAFLGRPAEDERLRKLAQPGFSLAKIAEQMERTKSSVRAEP